MRPLFPVQYDLADRISYTDNADSVDMPQIYFNSHYDFEGNRTWLQDSLGGGISYAWNNQRLQSMVMYTENNKSAQVGFGYDSVGRLASLTRTTNWDIATTINTGYTLDLLDRVTSITHSKGMSEDASTLSGFTYDSELYRARWHYGSGRLPSHNELQRIMNEVYSLYPLP